MKLTIMTKMFPMLLLAMVLTSCDDKSDAKETYEPEGILE